MNDMLELMELPEELAIKEELRQTKLLLEALTNPEVRKATAEAWAKRKPRLEELLIPLQEMPMPSAKVFYGHLCLSTSETPETLPPSAEGLTIAS